LHCVLQRNTMSTSKANTYERNTEMNNPMTTNEILALNAAYDAALERNPDESTHIITHDVAIDAGLTVVREDDESGILYRNAEGRYVYGWQSGGFDDQVN
jgi:hypothetical protein